MKTSTLSFPDAWEIKKALKHHFGFETFKGEQLEIIQSLLSGEDVFVLMPTGGGKSLCYQLPALISEGVAIIVSPLIALMKNQVDAIRHFEEADHVAHFLNSTLSKGASEKVREDVREGRTKLLYVAPESLAKEENVEFLKTVRISFFAIDEAHCISEWGHDFRPEYRKLRPLMAAIGDFPVIALTATATPKVQHDIQKNLGILNARVFKSSFNRPNLYYEIRPKTKDIDRDLIRLIRGFAGKSGIIYCLSRKRVEELAETLVINGIKALPYHAGMDTASRSANQDAFLKEEAEVIVATVAFGMGIDKPDVRYVIHYDLPKSLEGYYQETGRAGRDGGEGRCITFYSRKDLQKLEKLIQSRSVCEQEISRQLLIETADYAESSVCRRKVLLHYFGENYPEDNCGNCDNCLTERKKIECTREAREALALVGSLSVNRRPEYITNLLIGRATDEIRNNGDNETPGFGSLEDMEERHVGMLLRQLVIAGYLSKELENYGALRLTEEGKSWLKAPVRFMLVEDADYTEIQTDTHHEISGALDPPLFNMLKSLRKEIARKQGVPPYLIFMDPTLESMATTYPVSFDELLAVPGVGAGKATKYGAPFIDLILHYVEDNDIIRPEDMRVKTIAKKSNRKVAVIQGVDRKIDLDQLSEGLGMDFPELLAELESVVEAGAKLDITYFVEQMLDEDQIDEIYDWFSKSEDGDVESAIQALGEEYSEEDIRLVRVKYISEFGN